MRHLVLPALIVAATAACQNAASPRDDSATFAPSAATESSRPDLRHVRAALISVGNELSSAMAEKGVVEGLATRLAGNVLFLGPRTPTLQGKDAAVDWLSTNPIAPSAIQWEVLAADVSNDATQGFTWTGATIRIDLGTGPSDQPAFFLIYWRRGAGGDWRIAAIVFNLGGPQTGPLPAGFGTPTTGHRPKFPQVSSDRLLNVDARFSAASVEDGTGPAFERFAAPNAMAVSGGQFVFGPEAIGEAFAENTPDDVVSWVPRFAGVAESGDLGFTVGDATFVLVDIGTFFTKYLTVWQKQDNGRWRFVADFGNSRPGP